MTEVRLEKHDEVHLRVVAERSAMMELAEKFTFVVDGYKFTPAYRSGTWDGKIRLLNMRTGLIYLGLLDEVASHARDLGYKVRMDWAELAEAELSETEAEAFVMGLVRESKVPGFEARPYQIQTFLHCVRKNRALMLSPTSSGKSFIIYSLIRYYGLKTLVIVDGTAPVHQMASDFVSYGYPADGIHKIFSGQEKDDESDVYVATWQSLQKMPKKWFEKFGVIIGDEAHHFQAKSFTALMEKTSSTKFKFGFTGTLDGSKTNKMVLEGLFGRVQNFVTTSQLIEQGYVSDLRIQCIVLQYDPETKKRVAKGAKEYDAELDFLVTHGPRNRFIKNLALSQKGNTVVFVNFVEKHGKVLADMIEEAAAEKEKRVIFIHGGVDAEERSGPIRQAFEESDNIIGVATYGSFSTAISINNIHNIIFASPTKSRIRNLQSIGRGLRKHKSKDYVTLYDIADNLIFGSRKNHTIKHFAERVQTYEGEKFKFKIYNVMLS